eukprot:1348721-Pyramimonas_sp.AAC.1
MTSRDRRRPPQPPGDAKRRQQAEVKIKMREISRARILLTSTGLAPGTDATLAELQDEDLRPRRLTEDIPDEILQFQP